MKALVTGATGFIGSHLAAALSKRRYEVTCLVRKTSGRQWLEGIDARLVEGDCSDKHSLRDCVKGQDYILHLAGITKAVRKEHYYSANADGTGNLIEAVAENDPGVRRFIYLSSLSAFGPHSGGGPAPTEDETPHPVSDYGRSKLMGEQAVLRHSSNVPVTILRPSVVYGPRDRDFFLLFKSVARGFTPYWGHGRTSLIYVDDLVEGIILAAENDASSGKTYFISDGEAYSNSEIINAISSELGVKAVRVRVPRSLLSVIGFFSDGISKMLGKNNIINSDKIREIMHPEWVCDITRAKRDLNYQPSVDLKKGIKWTADWYRIHKWL